MRLPYNGTFPKTQGFNDPCCRGSYAKFNLLGHNGHDIGLPAWTPVLAPHSGVIKEATFDPGYGNYVKVENLEEGSVLAHLSRISVNAGDLVSEGDLIGYSGNTGNSTGPHLHWGFYRTKTRNRDNGFNGFIDQTDWMNVAGRVTVVTQPDPNRLNDDEVQLVRNIENYRNGNPTDGQEDSLILFGNRLILRDKSHPELLKKISELTSANQQTNNNLWEAIRKLFGK